LGHPLFSSKIIKSRIAHNLYFVNFFKRVDLFENSAIDKNQFKIYSLKDVFKITNWGVA